MRNFYAKRLLNELNVVAFHDERFSRLSSTLLQHYYHVPA